MENGNRGRVVAVDVVTGTLKLELSGDRTVTLPRDYLERRTARGGPTIVHGYAGTAHIAQGSTTSRAFVLGSDAAYHEWGYVAWSRARRGTRFYVCEPAVDECEDHHTAAGQPPRAIDDIVRTMEQSRGQRAAIELVACRRVPHRRGPRREAPGRARPGPMALRSSGDGRRPSGTHSTPPTGRNPPHRGRSV